MKTIFINDLEKAIREDLEEINTDTINIYTSYDVIKYSKEEYLENKINYCKELLLSIKINQLECSVCYDRDNIDFYFINNENEYIYNNDNSCYMVIEEEKTEEEEEIIVDIFNVEENTIINEIEKTVENIASFKIDYTYYDISIIRDTTKYINIHFYNTENGYNGDRNIFKFKTGKNDNYFNMTIKQFLEVIINEEIEEKEKLLKKLVS